MEGAMRFDEKTKEKLDSVASTMFNARQSMQWRSEQIENQRRQFEDDKRRAEQAEMQLAEMLDGVADGSVICLGDRFYHFENGQLEDIDASVFR